jgi:protein involved in polysaccharide export with SLBB domain
MTNALLVSGGISQIGSLRNIQLRRNGREPSDVICIPLVGRKASIGGEVKRPAVYELVSVASVSDLIELTGGLLPTAYAPTSQIERIGKDREGEASGASPI